MTEPTPPRTPQELYNRIRQVGREAVILEEMIRLGFWPARGEMPDDPVEDIHRKAEIHQELQEIQRRFRLLQDETVLRQQALQERLAASRLRQQENRDRRERERQERAAAWQQRHQQEIGYLGEGVSGGLLQTTGDPERLKQWGLPEVQTPEQISALMGISVGELRFLAFERRVAIVSHYIRFRIPKKSGGDRLISAPMPRLKRAQYWICDHLLSRLDPHEAAHGFCAGRSIVSNALPHVGADVVINLDLQDFFPSIAYARVKGLFRSLGYSQAAATVFALLCTESDRERVELDGQIYHVAFGERRLPQGSPASPAIANLICRRLDRRLTAMAQAQGFTYSRYADDLTFSGSGAGLTPRIGRVIDKATDIVTHEGFTVHPVKTRILRRNSSQLEVTGVVINEKPTVDRKTLKKFRALLFQIEKDGLTGKHWGHSQDVMRAIQSFAAYVAMINPEKGAEFLAQVQRIRAQYKPKRRRGI